MRRAWRRLSAFVIGWLIVAVGLVLLPLPGPGTLIILAGVSVLAREFRWARRLKLIALRRAKHLWRSQQGRRLRGARLRATPPDSSEK